MSKRLEGKAALITGASKGIGKGIAKVFLDEGASVFLCARGEHQLAKTADELSSRGEVSFLAADVADPGDAERLGLRAVEMFPHLSILLNNASILGKRQAIADVDIATWDDVLRVNTSSLFYITKPLVPHFVERGDGSIINVSSSVGRHGKPNWGPYAVSKFGLEGFTQVLGRRARAARRSREQREPGSGPAPTCAQARIPTKTRRLCRLRKTSPRSSCSWLRTSRKRQAVKHSRLATT